MEKLTAKDFGRLIIGDTDFTVFTLTNGKRAVSQPDVYSYLTVSAQSWGRVII
jgi:hypothetical protein